MYRVARLCIVARNDSPFYAAELVLDSHTRNKEKEIENMIMNKDYCETGRISFFCEYYEFS